MPFPRPSLSELRTQTATDINAALPGVEALLRFSNLGIMAEVLAALSAGHYGYADWIALQSVPFTATGEYLEGWAGLKGIIRKATSAASGPVSFVATDGATLPAGTVINTANGFSYTIDTSVIAAGGIVTAQMTATAGGADGNCAAGTAVSLGAGISGISSIGSAASAIVGGADLESDADLRSRMLAAYATPPQGGSITDYPSWALMVPGVTRAWLRPGAHGVGTLDVLFMMDVAQAAHGGFPQGTDGVSAYETRDSAATGDQLAVADAIFPKQAVTALVYAVAPLVNALDLTIAGIPAATAATKTAIAAAVQSALIAGAIPGGVTDVSVINAAIAAVPASAGFVLTQIAASAGTVLDGPAGNIQSNAAALPSLDSISYV